MPDEKPKPKPAPKPARKPKDAPDAPPKGRPGHRGGGWPKSGNAVGVGRKSNEIRADMLRTVDRSRTLMESILDGEFRQPMHDGLGNVVGHRPATIVEIVRVFDALAKHGLGTKTELSGPNGGAIPIESTTLDADAMLDRLSDDDLAALRAISARVHADPAAE